MFNNLNKDQRSDPAPQDAAGLAAAVEDITAGAPDQSAAETAQSHTDVAQNIPSQESLEDCVEECEVDPDAPEGDDKLDIRFGAQQIKFDAPEAFPHITEIALADGSKQYDIYVFQPIEYYGRQTHMIQHLIQLLDHATEQDSFRFFVNTPGGAIAPVCCLVSAMNRTRARTETIAAGIVASAGTAVFNAGQVRTVLPASVFMFHFSSHWAYGNSREVSATSAALVKYVQTHLIDPMVANGLMTEDEAALIVKGEDVYIPGPVMQARLAAPAPAEEEPESAPETEEETSADEPAADEEAADTPTEPQAPAEEATEEEPETNA